jgi:hypothetical protein
MSKLDKRVEPSETSALPGGVTQSKASDVSHRRTKPRQWTGTLLRNEQWYLYSWGPRGNLPAAMSRKGERCRLLARGRMNSGLVAFEDGFEAVVSMNALRKLGGS